MQSSLFEHLTNSGIDPEQAETIASGFSSEEPDVDVSQLTKAMGELSDTLETGSRLELENAPDSDSDAGVIEALAKASDVLLEEHREQNSAIAQALLRIGEEIVTLREDVTSLHKSLGTVHTASEDLQRSMSDVEDALNVPQMRKSMSDLSDVEVLDHPSEERHATAQDLIAKALTEMQTDKSNASRNQQLRQAVAMLEIPTVNPAEVATRFGL